MDPMANPNPNPNPNPDLLRSTASKAVDSLLRWTQFHTKNLLSKHPIDPSIHLAVTLTLPLKPRPKPYLIPLPHSPTSSILLVPNTTLPDPPPNAKVLTFTDLRAESKSSDAKRKLFGSYGLVFVDSSLGKEFRRYVGEKLAERKSGKLVWVDFGGPNWREKVKRRCMSVAVRVREGVMSYELRIGRVSMGKDVILENVVAGVGRVCGGGLGCVGSVCVKSGESVPLPVYTGLGNECFDGEKRKRGEECGSEKKIKLKKKIKLGK